MRILAFSDLHGNEAAASALETASVEADVVIGVGDFGVRGAGSERTLALLDDILCPLVIVSGNHDQRALLGDVCARRPGWHLLHGSAITLGGKTFLGIGGEIPRLGTAAWNESIEEEVATELLARTPGCDVLVTHTPPLGYADLQRDGSHEGNRSIHETVLRDQPELCLCGHIHHSWGAIERIGSTLVHNLGPTLNWHIV